MLSLFCLAAAFTPQPLNIAPASNARAAVAPTMLGVATAVKLTAVGAGAAGVVFSTKALRAKSATAAAAKGREALAGMSGLSDLSSLSLDQEEMGEARILGDWKEYTKSNGKVWYYQISTGKMQWTVPDVFKEAMAEGRA